MILFSLVLDDPSGDAYEAVGAIESSWSDFESTFGRDTSVERESARKQVRILRWMADRIERALKETAS